MPKVYQDEQTAFDDFKANKCHAVVITGTRARALVPFTGTLEAMGALPSYKMLKRVIKTLSSPRASKLMKSGAYETAGIVPGGAVYLYVRDRQVDTVKELAGRKIATLSFDKAAKTMVNKVGASMISAEISNFAGMFNNKTVDACYAPAFAYKALELHKGIGAKGGVVRRATGRTTPSTSGASSSATRNSAHAAAASRWSRRLRSPASSAPRPFATSPTSSYSSRRAQRAWATS